MAVLEVRDLATYYYLGNKELKAVDDTGDAFMKKLNTYFEEKRIRILEKIKVKKRKRKLKLKTLTWVAINK